MLCAVVSTCPVPAGGHPWTHTIEQTEQGREMGWGRGEVLGNWATMAICGQARAPLVDFNAFIFGLILG